MLKFSDAQPGGDCYQIIWQASVTMSDPIGCGYTILRDSITLLEFLVVKVRKSLIFACENSLHF